MNWLRRLFSPTKEVFCPATLELRPLGTGALLVAVFPDGVRLDCALPRDSAKALLDGLLDVLQIGDDSEPNEA